MFENTLTENICGFLIDTGFDVQPASSETDTFLPGISIESGKIFVNEDKLQFPGDLLHEAGHLAVAPREIRHLLGDEIEIPGVNLDAIEAGAIAWSYAAAIHLGLDPRIVFHDGGYKGNSESLLMNFSLGVFIGLNILIEAEMCVGPIGRGTGIETYPRMLKWLRD